MGFFGLGGWGRHIAIDSFKIKVPTKGFELTWKNCLLVGLESAG
jgi:hypothetical protein